jgi:hypothetical protein
MRHHSDICHSGRMQIEVDDSTAILFPARKIDAWKDTCKLVECDSAHIWRLSRKFANGIWSVRISWISIPNE